MKSSHETVPQSSSGIPSLSRESSPTMIKSAGNRERDSEHEKEDLCTTLVDQPYDLESSVEKNYCKWSQVVRTLG